ncbi:neuroligin-4, X-linked-like [Mercenaria mercenaria]|uniref:neuroligin-4, X-linked-like n=1 Tax=Mercenaria mercenaria TaxID=6596 RepID=UPI00234EE428|nr:neuroligin-4, X-linked-like [Mercenaria mercenaria]
MQRYMLILLAIGVKYCHGDGETTTVTVESPQGKFKGYVRSFESFGNQYRVRRFLGIPYAEPPTGSRRFKKPVKKEANIGIFDATKRGTACQQLQVKVGGRRNTNIQMNFSDDCLFLNIFAPDVPVSKQKLPVMIFIHGGVFDHGFSDYSVGDILSVYGDVVVVTINYRLNIWGFLSTGDDYLPGNLGLWDQKMAIEWVHNNIASFSGDSELLTLFGHSAGATSAIYQSMFPGNKGLFKRIIAMSGSITSPWAYNENPLIATRKYGALLGCTQDDTGSLSTCITSKSTTELHKALNDHYRLIKFPLDFLPVKDGEFIPLSPKEIFHASSETAKERRELFADKELITGVVSSEALVFISPALGITNDTDNFTLSRTEFENKCVTDVVQVMFGTRHPNAIRNLLVAEYTDWNDPNNDKRSMASLIQIGSDYAFNIQAIETLKVFNKVSNHKAYAYVVDAMPSQHLLRTPAWTTKPNHGDDLTFLFGHDSVDGFTKWTEPFGDGPPADWEHRLSKAIITMWTNFAKSGDPNAPTPLTPLLRMDWPAYDKNTEAYLNISNDIFSIGQRMFARSYNLWMNVLPAVISDIDQAASVQISPVESEGTCAP